MSVHVFYGCTLEKEVKTLFLRLLYFEIRTGDDDWKCRYFTPFKLIFRFTLLLIV